MRLNINGKTYDVDVDPNTPLFWVIGRGRSNRHQIRLRHCAVWRVHRASRWPGDAFLRPCRCAAVVGKKITTIEGLAMNGVQPGCRKPGSKTTCHNAATVNGA